jgi:hypothetical protein
MSEGAPHSLIELFERPDVMRCDPKVKFFETKFRPYESFSITMNKSGILTTDKKIHASALLDISISNSVELLNKTLDQD